MGDKVISPSRQVQNTIPMGDKPPADDEPSHSPSIEEIHKIDMPEFNTEEKETTEAPKERAREGASGLWRKWNRRSQQRHCRWKTRNANVARVKRRQPEGGIAEPPMREASAHESYTETCPTDAPNETPTQQMATPICIVSEDMSEVNMD